MQEGVDSPFIPKSDEEKVEKKKDEDKGEEKGKSDKDKDKEKGGDKDEKAKDEGMKIDLEGIDRRTIALPLPTANYFNTAAGPAGSVFIAEFKPGNPGITLQKFSLDKRESY